MTTIHIHPEYTTWAPIWRKLLDCYEGIGGFQDGSYLIPHPREWKDHDAETPRIPTAKLTRRRQLARYENVAATIVDAKRSALFRKQPSRIVGNAANGILQWWDNVDGRGTHIDDYAGKIWIPAAVFGYVFVLIDRPLAQPLTRAEQPVPYLRAYSPLDIIDWLDDGAGRLLSITLLEPEPRRVGDPPTIKYQHRILTSDTWQVISSAGERVGQGEHKCGRVPGCFLYAKRRTTAGLVGQSVLHDPKLFIEHYNLTSELRELLRNQTFGILNVELGTGTDAPSVEQAAKIIGEKIGTDNILFSPGPAQFLSPDAANVAAYQSERDGLMRAIYRLCAIPWEADSRDAEAEGSMKLKREDMNQVLSNYADELEKFDYEIAELFHRMMHAGDVTAFARDQIVIRYPDSFDVTPFSALLEQAQAAMALEMPAAVKAELKRRLLPELLPDLTPDKKKTLDAAIDAMSADDNAESRTRNRVRQSAAALRDLDEPPTPPTVQ